MFRGCVSRLQFRWCRFHMDRSGLAAVLFALGLTPLLMGGIAMVMETGFIVSERSDRQWDADSAALAGAQLVGQSENAAIGEAIRIATLNIENLDDVTVTVSGATVTVTLRNEPESIFSDVSWLRFDQRTVRASASARLAAPTHSGPGVVLIALPFVDYEAINGTSPWR